MTKHSASSLHSGMHCPRPAAAGRTFRVVVCESRPLNEGATLANTLADAGVDVTLITDAQAGMFVGRADIVLVGADSLTQDAVVNKVRQHTLCGWGGSKRHSQVGTVPCESTTPLGTKGMLPEPVSSMLCPALLSTPLCLLCGLP